MIVERLWLQVGFVTSYSARALIVVVSRRLGGRSLAWQAPLPLNGVELSVSLARSSSSFYDCSVCAITWLFTLDRISPVLFNAVKPVRVCHRL